MATNAENNSEPQRYSESDLKKLKTWSLESRAHQALKDYSVKWETVRDGPCSTPADVQLACLMLSQPPEAEQCRIDAELRIWAREWELRDLIAELHPEEDGGLMLKKLDAFVTDENTRKLVVALAAKHASDNLSAEKSKKAEIAKNIANEIYAFFPLRSIDGGDGRVKRLQLVAALEPATPTPSRAEPASDAKPWFSIEPRDPPAEQPWYIPARYFARQLVVADSTLLTKRLVLAGQVSQSLAGAGIFKRGGKKPPSVDTVLKALVNVSLG